MSGLTNTLLNYIGITAPPTSVAELIWDFILICMALVVIKLIISCLFGMIKMVGKW